MKWLLLTVLAWLILSFPFAVLLGHWLRRRFQ